MELVRAHQVRDLVNENVARLAVSRQRVIPLHDADPAEPRVSRVVVGVSTRRLPYARREAFVHTAADEHTPNDVIGIVYSELARVVRAVRPTQFRRTNRTASRDRGAVHGTSGRDALARAAPPAARCRPGSRSVHPYLIRTRYAPLVGINEVKSLRRDAGRRHRIPGVAVVGLNRARPVDRPESVR